MSDWQAEGLRTISKPFQRGRNQEKPKEASFRASETDTVTSHTRVCVCGLEAVSGVGNVRLKFERLAFRVGGV